MRKVDRKLILIAGVLGILILMVLKAKLFQYSPSQEYHQRALKHEPDRTDRLNKELQIASNKVDSLKTIKETLVDDKSFFSGFTLGALGIGTLTTNSQMLMDRQEYVKFTYVGLELNEEIGKNYFSYFSKNGQGYISTLKFVARSDYDTVSYSYQRVPFKYLFNEKSVLLPVKNKFVAVLINLISLAVLVIFFAAILFVAITFFKFLFAIAKNQAFEPGNVQRLRDMSIVLLALSIVPWVLNYISYLFFKLNYYSEGILFTYSFLEHGSSFLIFAILTYLIYTAFSNAMAMQQEQELTI